MFVNRFNACNKNPCKLIRIIIIIAKNICSYRLRVECMLLKAEFEANMSFLEPSLESMLTAGEGGFNIFFVSVLYLVLLNFDIITKYS